MFQFQLFNLLFIVFIITIFTLASGQGDLDSLIAQVYPAPDKNGQLQEQQKQQQQSTKPPPPPPVETEVKETIDLTPTKTGGSDKDEGGPQKPAEGCTCVPYYLCKNNSIITDGVGLIDIRIKEGPCENYFEICCGESDKLKEPDQEVKKPVIERLTGCGYRNPEGVGFRITGASDGEAQFAEFPWMVAILREEPVEGSTNKLNVYQCGGSLIHPQVVLTAAHCVTGKNHGKKYKIRAGEWDTQTKNEIHPHQDRDVQTVVTHDHYRSGTLYNDIALLVLQSPVNIVENVDVVCLPDAKQVSDSSECFASGWGKDVFGKEGKYQVILKKVKLPMVEHSRCQQLLQKTRLGKHFELHRSFVCAGGEPGKDTCKGDGGSPLVCPIPGQKGRYYQQGIVAWGIGCGEQGTPGVYTNVPELREWVDEQMAYQRHNISSYKYQ